jgi:cyanophycinase
MAGPLLLVGGGEFGPGCDFDRDVVAPAGRVLVLTTAAAYENPAKVAARARDWFAALGVEVVAPEAGDRRSAAAPEVVEAVAAAPAIYLTSGSAQHLRSVLKGSPLWDAIVAAWRGGAVLAGSQAGAAVLGDTMIDARGGGFTVGLGLYSGLSVLPLFDEWPPERIHRVRTLAPAGVHVVGVDRATALLHRPGRGWSSAGAGRVHVFDHDGQVALDALGDPSPTR